MRLIQSPGCYTYPAYHKNHHIKGEAAKSHPFALKYLYMLFISKNLRIPTYLYVYLR